MAKLEMLRGKRRIRPSAQFAFLERIWRRGAKLGRPVRAILFWNPKVVFRPTIVVASFHKSYGKDNEIVLITGPVSAGGGGEGACIENGMTASQSGV